MPFASPCIQSVEFHVTDLRLVWLPPTPSPSSFTYLTDTLLDDDDSARDDLENEADAACASSTFEFPAAAAPEPTSSIMASASSGTTGTTTVDPDALEEPAEAGGPEVDAEVPAADCRAEEEDCCLDLLDRFL